MAAQRAEDPAYLVKYLLNGVTGTPMKDMLRTVTRTFRSKPVDKKSCSVSRYFTGGFKRNSMISSLLQPLKWRWHLLLMCEC